MHIVSRHPADKIPIHMKIKKPVKARYLKISVERQLLEYFSKNEKSQVDSSFYLGYSWRTEVSLKELVLSSTVFPQCDCAILCLY